MLQRVSVLTSDGRVLCSRDWGDVALADAYACAWLEAIAFSNDSSEDAAYSVKWVEVELDS